MNQKKRATMFCVMFCFFAIVLDQASKLSIISFVNAGSVVKIFPSFNLILTFNTGTSFGLLVPNSQAEYFLIIALSVFCIVFLLNVFIKLCSYTEKIFYSLLIGGAISNLIDRFVYGSVVDFIDLSYKNWHWPAFNLADAFICCSAVSLIVFNLFFAQKHE